MEQGHAYDCSIDPILHQHLGLLAALVVQQHLARAREGSLRSPSDQRAM